MKRKLAFFSAILFAPVLLFWACSNYFMDSILNGNFVAVKGIYFSRSAIPQQNIPLHYLAAIYPANATSKSIEWKVQDYAGSGLFADRGTLYAEGTWTGKLTLKATIHNGLARGKDYIKILTIEIKSGGGDPENPWLVHDQETLKRVGLNTGSWLLDKYYLQIADIPLKLSNDWTPIGNSVFRFSGLYDGGGYTISEFHHTGINLHNFGLFGYIGPGGIIQNVNLVDSRIYDIGTYNNSIVNIGGIAGINNNGTIINCNVSGAISGSNKEYVGGIVGYNTIYGKIISCSFKGDITGFKFVGGIAGYNSTNTEINNCSVSGSVSGVDQVGGIVGENNFTVNNCYSTGNVTGNSYAGGIVGKNAGDIKHCYATGNVTGNNYAGGIAGVHSGGTITNCVALSKKITASSDFGPIDGDKTFGGTVAYNYYRYDMNDAFFATLEPSSLVFVTVLGSPYLYDRTGFWGAPGDGGIWNDAWDFTNTWDWNSGTGLPILRGMPAGVQNPQIRN